MEHVDYLMLLGVAQDGIFPAGRRARRRPEWQEGQEILQLGQDFFASPDGAFTFTVERVMGPDLQRHCPSLEVLSRPEQSASISKSSKA